MPFTVERFRQKSTYILQLIIFYLFAVQCYETHVECLAYKLQYNSKLVSLLNLRLLIYEAIFFCCALMMKIIFHQTRKTP